MATKTDIHGLRSDLLAGGFDCGHIEHTEWGDRFDAVASNVTVSIYADGDVFFDPGGDPINGNDWALLFLVHGHFYPDAPAAP